MSNSTNWLRKTAFVGLGSALALGTALGTAGSASAEINDTTFQVSAVQAARGADNVPLSTVTLAENEDGDFILNGVDNELTLTLSEGTFVQSSQDDVNVTVSNGASTINQNGDDDVTITGNTVTISIAGSPSPSTETLTVSGLRVDVPTTATDDIEATFARTGGFGPDADLPVDNDDVQKDVITLGVPPNVANFTRVGGSDRYNTAAQAFRATAEGGVAVVAGGSDYPDALSASYLASRAADGAGTGILLTKPGSLPAPTQQALLDLNITKVFIVGGTTAVSSSVESQIRNLRIANGGNDAGTIQVVRLGGANRYATNQAVNVAQDESLTTRPTSTPVLVASGAGFADAVALGTPAYQLGRPLVLTQGTSLTSQARDQIELFNPSSVDVAGGTVSISDATFTQIREAARNAVGNAVTRIAGAERTATAVAIANWSRQEDGGFPADAVNRPSIANGAFFADALAAGPLNAKVIDAPTLLTQNANALGAGLTGYLNGLNRTDDGFSLTVFGLNAVMPQAQVDRIARALGDGQ